MILLDITPNEFIKRHPELRAGVIDACEEEDILIDTVQPYITKEMIGVILNPMAKERQMRVFTHRDENKSEEYGKLLSNILTEQI